jgi:hypothetical protein
MYRTHAIHRAGLIGAGTIIASMLAFGEESRALVNGELVSEAEHERLGLVEIGGCSGALLTNRVAVTAKHCITGNEFYSKDPKNLDIKAVWGRPGYGQSTKGLKYFFADYDLAVVTLEAPISVNGVPHGFRQPVWLGNPILEGAKVVAYGMGPYAFARKVGVPTMINGKLVEIGEIGEQPSQYDNKYRKANADVSNVNPKYYSLTMLGGRQIGGGDSGGPSFLGAMLTGVHTSCAGDRILDGHQRVAGPGSWHWIAQTWGCNDAPLHAVWNRIEQIIAEAATLQVGSPLTTQDPLVRRHNRTTSHYDILGERLSPGDTRLRPHNRATSRAILQPTPDPLVSPGDQTLRRHDSRTSRRVLDVAVAPQTPPTPHPATCKSGYVWRVARADDLVCVTPESRARVAQENRMAAERRLPDGRCRSGYVWREAFNGDGVCVTPQTRALVREENRIGPTLRALAGGTPVPQPTTDRLQEIRLRQIERSRREREQGPIVR